MFKKAALRLRLNFILLSVFVILSAVPMFACAKKTTAPTASSGSCGSGDVYWDAGVSRCRDHANGRFVSSSCCGH